MSFQSINPYNGEVLAEFEELTTEQLGKALELAASSFQTWKAVDLDQRSALLARVADVLRDNQHQYAQKISQEMGKPITEALAEVNKCAWVCEYYATHAADFLADESIPTEAYKSYVRHDPIGVVLAIMPWNFPFWQVFRFAAPTLVAGNVGLLKHAANVLGCAELIESIFLEAGFPQGVFQHLPVSHSQIEQIVAHPAVRAVSLTGSERAGSSVAALAGKYLKKSLLELGGSNAFIVLADADLDQAVALAVNARMLNAGQSCIAAKRFILESSIYPLFADKFVSALQHLQAGDPMSPETQIGPLARLDLADTLHRQVEQSIAQGAQLLLGGQQSGCFYAPTVLGDVLPGMPAFDEETFGPLAALISAEDEAQAYELANQSRFGLGATVCTRNVARALEMAGRVDDGAFFINELVKSDPRLPFGGTKLSGYGRELSRDGLLEFVNRKTVYAKQSKD